jgi:hypothetical protein
MSCMQEYIVFIENIFFTHKEISSEVFDLSFTVTTLLCNAGNELCLRTYSHVNIVVK